MSSEIRIQREAFDAGGELAKLGEGDAGGVASFIGIVRGDDGVEALELEHYPGMTEAALRDIAANAQDRWPLSSLVVIHRIGRLAVGEPIVLVGAASAHRTAAIEAMHFVIDRLKTDAPFWKREWRVDGEARWVEARATDDEALERWT